jgi:hypothetical protein
VEKVTWQERIKLKQKDIRKLQQEKRKQNSQKNIELLERTVELDSSSSSSDESQRVGDNEIDDVSYASASGKHKRRSDQPVITSKCLLFTANVAAALDRTKVTDREAVHVLAATAQALGHDIDSLPLSHSPCSVAIQRRMCNPDKA